MESSTGNVEQMQLGEGYRDDTYIHTYREAGCSVVQRGLTLLRCAVACGDSIHKRWPCEMG